MCSVSLPFLLWCICNMNSSHLPLLPTTTVDWANSQQYQQAWLNSYQAKISILRCILISLNLILNKTPPSTHCSFFGMILQFCTQHYPLVASSDGGIGGH